MSQENTFNGAFSAMTFFTAYQNAVADEMGVDKANSINTKMCETMGALQGQMMKQNAGPEEIGPSEALSLMKPIFNNLGISTEIAEETPQKVVINVGKCPIFEAGQMLGRDLEAMETGCRCGAARFMDSMTKQLNPNLEYQLEKYRTSSDDFCREVILKK